MEQTLLILKPDAVMRRGVGATTLNHLLKTLPDVEFFGYLEMAVPRSLAEQHYAIHQCKFFYPWLLQFIQVGNVLATVLEGDDIVVRLREVLGATFVEKASPTSLRGRYGLVGGVNVAHASDEPENALKEIDLWRREANLEINIDSRGAIDAYIANWGEVPILGTEDIRRFCQEYAQEYLNRDQFLTQIAEILVSECPDWSDQEIQKLADAILGNMDLDRGTL